MSAASAPEEIYDRAKTEGRRRLLISPLDQITTAFIAGVTIVFGMAALGVVHALVEPELGSGLAKLAGAIAFGIGFVFLIVGRAELFSENFFDPVAAAIDMEDRRRWGLLLRLWAFTFGLNLVGGAVLLAVLTVEGALPSASAEVLVKVAEEFVSKSSAATLARAVLAGALITLMSYMLVAVDSSIARIVIAYVVGVLLALGPFDHVIVSGLHILYGVWESDAVSYADFGLSLLLSTLGNLVGGLLLMTFTHAARAKSR